MICTPLHEFINGGDEFCKLSGFDTNHISINCFDGYGYRKNKKNKISSLKIIDNKERDNSYSPTISPTISSSDLHTIEHDTAPSLQNLNM